MKKIKILLLSLLTAGTLYLQPIFSKTDNKINISFIDVGQGDSILIDGKKDMLIDCGDEAHADDLALYLFSKDIEELEYLVITHTDSDHIGGCERIISNFTVKNVMMDGQERNTKAYTNVSALVENKIIPKNHYEFNLSDIKFKVVHANVNSKDPNQNSIVLRMDYNKVSALFTGDCDKGCEKELLNEDIDVDILKVAHHCSKYGTSTTFLDKVTPEIAVISVGEKNKYKHPHKECLDNLKYITVYRTDIRGNVIVEADGLDYKIK